MKFISRKTGTIVALVMMNFRSKAINMQTTVNAIIPDVPVAPLKTLYLFHGMHEDENSWLNQTALRRYAAKRKMAIVLPSVGLSYYANQRNGQHYFDFVAEELVEKTRGWWPLSANREDTFVAGDSMGGYGALKCGLNYPERFGTVFAFSPMPDIVGRWRSTPERDAWYKSLFGSLADLETSSSNLYRVVRANKDAPLKPAIFQLCGRDDPFWPMNQEFYQLLIANGYQATFIPSTGGHEWPVWDNGIQFALDRIVNSDNESE
jgi:putative lysine transport system ATP-binding protein